MWIQNFTFNQSMKLIIAYLVSVAFAQQNIDVTSKSAILTAAKAAVWPLRMFFDDNNEGNGAWIEQYSDSQWNVQWHETGEYWELFYKYMLYSGDTSYLSWVDAQMQISAGGFGDFLDGNNPLLEEAGRWNDDIGWWGIATMAATEAFGKDAIVAKENLQPGVNPKYFDLSNNTFYEIWMGWDDKTCNGGIFWSRSRSTGTDAQKYYKSTITNVEEMELGARLYALTGISYYKDRVDQIYAWLQSTGLLTSDYIVYDGLDSRTCQTSPQIYSYHSGCLLAALSFMYKATNDAHYITEAHKLFVSIKKQFVDPTNGTLSIEPSCQARACRSPSGYSWPLYKGLADLYAYSNDASVKASVADVMGKTGAANFAGCDANWYCIRNLPAGTQFTLQNGTNVRDQFETVSILNALAVINGAPVPQALGPQGVSVPVISASNGPTGAGSSAAKSGAISARTSGNALLFFIFFLFV
ncbi:glycosyl hydrolase family 76-domain-containing protein [Chytriomyces sp. MP71]|nr:glycosyl hydrolase family 76-domain-containing protein [Chytriomyces sp. MP71]